MARPFALVALTLALAGCGGAPAHTEPTVSSRCEEGEATQPPAALTEWGPPPEGEVARLEVRGLRTVPESLARGALGDRVGHALELEQVREDITALLALEVFEDVQARAASGADGIVLTYEVRERPLLGGVEIRGDALSEPARELPSAGELYDPVAIDRAAERLAAQHRMAGYFEARAIAQARRDGERVRVCFDVEPGRRRVVDSFEIAGSQPIEASELLGLMDTHGGRVNVRGAIFDEEALEVDIVRWTALYFDRGMVEVRVHEPQTRWDAEGRFHVRVPIDGGRVYRIGRLAIDGDLSAPPARYRSVLHQRSGDVFNRSLIAQSVDELYAIERELGRDRDGVMVTPRTELHPERGVIDIVLEVQALGAHEEPQ